MTAMSNYLETALFNHVLRNVSFTSPATIYLALYTSDPTDADTGTEVSGNAYARVQITGGNAFGAPSNGQGSNAGAITFPMATPGAWGTITHVGIRDASSGGNLLLHGQLAASRVVNAGDTFTIPAASLIATLS